MTRRLRTLLSLFADLLTGCLHRTQGSLWWHRDGKHYRVCQDCGQLVESPLVDPAGIKPPVLTCDIDRAARAAQVRACYEEMLAMRGPTGRTGLDRMKEPIGEPDWVRQSGVKL